MKKFQSLPTGSAQCRLSTPLGPMTALATPRGLAGLWFDGQAHHPGPLRVPRDPEQRHLQAAAAWLAAYWQGGQGVKRAKAPALDLQGTPFQQSVWAALQGIALGGTWTYGEIARHVGSPTAVRAVGAAVGRNPVSVIVPCHRVLGQGGALTGYAGGLPRKTKLLTHEGVALQLRA